MKSRTVVAAAYAIIAWMPSSILAAAGADTQFPNRPVRILIPTGPGGGTDFIARLVAQRLSERWGQNVVADNRAGATGLISLELLARAAPDGHTLAAYNAAQLLTAQLSGKLSFKRGGDFTALARTANTELLLVANASVPAKSLKELVALARAKPRTLNYASGGTGALGHLGLALFASIAGIELTHVPYQGTGPSIPDLLSGRVQLTLTTIPTVIQHVQTGRLRALAVAGAKRVPAMPETPTFAEAGYPRYDASVWFGIFGPARMPASVVARINADVNWAVRQPEVAERFSGAGFDPAGTLSAAQFADYVATDLVKWNEALKAAGMQ